MKKKSVIATHCIRQNVDYIEMASICEVDYRTLDIKAYRI